MASSNLTLNWSPSLGEELDHIRLHLFAVGELLGLIASESVLRVNVDVLEGAER